MLCPYVRSSSLNQFKLCEMRYTFEYLFGMPGKSGKPALLGTMFHKTQELRAQASKAIRLKEESFEDDNFGVVSVLDATNIEWTIKQAWDYYASKNKNPEIILETKDFDTLSTWVFDTLKNYSNYDPLNLHVIQTEQYFDFEVDKPWAKYSGIVDGKEVSGQLRMKGTMDLVIQVSDDTYELVDYKTGAYRSDFATGVEKDLDYLQNDVQLLLYLIALKKLWPDKHWILSLFYIRCGGIFSIIGDDATIERAYEMLEKNYKEISSCSNPTQLDPYNRNFKCARLCPFSKSASFTRGQSLCQHYKQKIERKGLQSVQDELVSYEKLFNYSEGGGRDHAEKGLKND